MTCSIDGCARPVLARGFCAPHYSTWHRQQCKYTIICGWCGKTANVQRSKAKYCSKACGGRANQELAQQGWSKQMKAKRAIRTLPVLYTGPPYRRKPKNPPRSIPGRIGKYFSGQCRICNTWFISNNTDVTCSDQCQRDHNSQMMRLAKDRRRARKREAFVQNVYRKDVFERDGYRCHICNKKTDPTKKVPHHKAPTIDHVIPLAVGGTHEPVNCRTACFLCNCTKGSRGGGEQLLLMA